MVMIARGCSRTFSPAFCLYDFSHIELPYKFDPIKPAVTPYIFAAIVFSPYQTCCHTIHYLLGLYLRTAAIIIGHNRPAVTPYITMYCG